MPNYLQIPGINGEVTERDYAGWMEVKNAVHGGDSGRGGSGTGRTGGTLKLTEVTFLKKQDKASGELMKATARGTHFPKVTLVVTRDQHKYLEYVFEEALISAYTTTEVDREPSETFLLNFEKVTFNYS